MPRKAVKKNKPSQRKYTAEKRWIQNAKLRAERCMKQLEAKKRSKLKRNEDVSGLVAQIKHHKWLAENPRSTKHGERAKQYQTA